MSREILFKARGIESGEWRYGYLVILPNMNPEHRTLHIFDDKTQDWYGIIPSTVCQYTGLTDKNGNRIFENDVVRKYVSCDSVKYTDGVIKYGVYNSPFGEYERTHVGFYIRWMKDAEKDYYRCDLGYWANELDVAGNVFDYSLRECSVNATTKEGCSARATMMCHTKDTVSMSMHGVNFLKNIPRRCAQND